MFKEINLLKVENEINILEFLFINIFFCFVLVCLRFENDIDLFIFIKIFNCNVFVFCIL